MKDKVLLIYGGKSVEHDISIITALQAEKQASKLYDVLLCYVDREGKWWLADNLADIDIYQNFAKKVKNARQVSLLLGEKTLLVKKGKKFVSFANIAVVLNCCHGNLGEDGCVQGLFRLCGIPQTSGGVTSSALCMDKVLMKDVCKANGIKTPQYISFVGKQQFSVNKTLKALKFPMVVKPSNLGSSIGISICKDEKQLCDAVDLALSFDRKILIEKLIDNLREFNCACLAYQGQNIVSHVNEVTNKGEIYSFEDKYLSSGGKGQEAEKSLARKIKNLTEKVYGLFDCKGIVRVDFLYDEASDELFVNEINSIPGSLAFYLFKELSFKELLEATISQSLADFEQQQKLVTSFESGALKTFAEVAQNAVKK